MGDDDQERILGAGGKLTHNTNESKRTNRPFQARERGGARKRASPCNSDLPIRWKRRRCSGGWPGRTEASRRCRVRVESRKKVEVMGQRESLAYRIILIRVTDQHPQARRLPAR